MPNSESKTDPEEKTGSISFTKRLAFATIPFLGFLVLVAAVEIVTRLAMSPVSSLDLFVTTPQQKTQVADAKQSGIFEGDPLLLWRLKPDLDNVIWDFTVVSTNSDHLRSEKAGGVIPAKKTGSIRVVCLGDSVTFGYRVPVVFPNAPTAYAPDWLPYPMLLEKQLRAANPNRNIDVITMAVPGYTSSQGLAWLRRDIDKLKPDLLTVSYGWNDASFSDVPDRDALKTDWSSVVVRWFVDHSQAFAHLTNWLRAKDATRQAEAANVPSSPPQPKPTPQSRTSTEEYLGNITAVEQLAHDRGSAVIVIAAPYRDHGSDAPEADQMLRNRLALGETMREKGVPFLELRVLTEDAYPANNDLFGERIHPNHMGHRLLASELLKLIDSGHMLSDLKIPTFTP